MTIKELIRQLKEYEKIYGPDSIMITRTKIIEYESEQQFVTIKDNEIDGLDFIGSGTILIATHVED